MNRPDGPNDILRVLPLHLRPLSGVCEGLGGILQSNAADVQRSTCTDTRILLRRDRDQIALAAALSVLGYVDTPTR